MMLNKFCYKIEDGPKNVLETKKLSLVRENVAFAEVGNL